ncbi:LytR C-terminal domain-containing protein [Sinomonas sp. G460-2]|uniref:LytR C-terminal domain-containing protein n=1 Tax=Sinomonas sp. G460-2 TaxID=3393464 RepID=UPI0039F0CB71
MSHYPGDEFDDVLEAPRRQGVHRTKGAVETGRRGIGGVIIAAAIVVILVAAALFIVPKLLGTSAATGPSASSGSSAPASAKGSGTPTPTPTPSSTPTPTQSAPAQADKTLAVGVYNATSTAGLGNRAAAAARNAGWTVAAVGNWTGSPVSSSVVFYKDPSQKASAQALAADLGIATVLQAQQLGYPLAVVAGPGYAG